MAAEDKPRAIGERRLENRQEIRKGLLVRIDARDLGRIEPLYVAESSRRQGLGRTMMSRALEICARSLFKHVFLSCMPVSTA